MVPGGVSPFGLTSEGRVHSWLLPQGLLGEGQYATFVQIGATATRVTPQSVFVVSLAPPGWSVTLIPR